MKLVNFSVSKFRSIEHAHRIPIFGTTVLVGKNNEGKSNILRALAIAMNAIKSHARSHVAVGEKVYWRRIRGEDAYDWKRDFPISLQENAAQGASSIFRLEFALDDNETNEFWDKIKSSLNGYLPIEIKIGADNNPKIQVKKGGKGSKVLNSKSAKITSFVADKIFFNYIPAVRTHQQTKSIIDGMLSEELDILEDNQDYKNAVAEIAKLEKPILEELAKRIKEPLVQFLPNIKSVKIHPAEDYSFSTRRDFNIVIDDGTPTLIEYKGDGVKSLAALGLLKNKSDKYGASIIAIEEPEAHLHPGAIHQLNEIISSLESKNQIVITTHNPLFINRADLKSNILVEDGKARPAKAMSEIRELLGIKASDNLVNAQYSLVVEGEEDRVSLLALLPLLSAQIGKALKEHLMVIEPIGGASNLSYKLSLIKSSLCMYRVLLDFDDAGRKAFEKAKQDSLLTLKDTTFTICQGMKDSEFEDCLDVAIYSDKILQEFGVSTMHPAFSSKDKWSERMKKAFMGQGKIWNDGVAAAVKSEVAAAVKDNPQSALNSHKRSSIDALVVALEKMIGIAPAPKQAEEQLKTA